MTKATERKIMSIQEDFVNSDDHSKFIPSVDFFISTFKLLGVEDEDVRCFLDRVNFGSAPLNQEEALNK